MKANTTKNVTSVVMIAIVVLLMTQTILVGVQAGINENGVLLLLLTLSSAVLSGINGFGRRTTKAVSLSARESARQRSQRSLVSSFEKRRLI